MKDARLICRTPACHFSTWSQEGRLIHEFQHYGWDEKRAREAVDRLTALADSTNGGNGWWGERTA